MYDIPFLLFGAVIALLFISACVIGTAFPKTVKSLDKKLSDFIGGEE